MKKIIILASILFLIPIISSISWNTNLIHTYGEMWNYTANSTAWTFDIDVGGAYYNLTNLNKSTLNGIGFTNAPQETGGSFFNITIPGTYIASLSFSFEATQVGSLYGIAIVKNFNKDISRNCYARRWGDRNKAGATSLSCLLSLEVNDNVNAQIENENNDRDINVHAANLNLVRISD